MIALMIGAVSLGLLFAIYDMERTVLRRIEQVNTKLDRVLKMRKG